MKRKEVFFRKISEYVLNIQTFLYFLFVILVIIVISIINFVSSSYFYNINIAIFVLIMLLVIMGWEKIHNALFIIYQYFNSLKTFFPCIEIENQEKILLPIESFFDYKSLIYKNIDKKIHALIFFPLLPEPDDSLRYSYMRLYKFYYVFSEKSNIMAFFIVSFFLLFFLYTVFTMSIFRFLLNEFSKNFTTIYFSILLITLLYALFIFIYVKSFQFSFIVRDIDRVESIEGERSNNYIVYHYRNGNIREALVLDDIVDNVIETKGQIESTINSILQIASPIFYVAYVTILFQILNLNNVVQMIYI